MPELFRTLRRLTMVVGMDLFERETPGKLVRLYLIIGSISVFAGQQFTSAYITQDLVVMTENTSTGIVMTCSILKLMWLRVVVDKVRELYSKARDLTVNTDPEDYPILAICERRIGYVVKIFLTMDGLTMIGALVPPFIHNLRHPDRPKLPFKSWFPYEPMTSTLVFGLTSAWLNFCAAMSAYNIALLRITFFCAALYISTQISVLIRHLEKLDPAKENFRLEMKGIVDLHAVILTLAQLMNDVFSYTHLFEVIVASIQSCMQLFQIIRVSISDPRLTLYVPFLIGSVTALFLICFVGELLKTKSQQVNEVAYEVPWHEMDPKTRREFLFVLRQSSRTLSLNVRGNFVMDMVLFLKTMQSAYTYMTIFTTLE